MILMMIIMMLMMIIMMLMMMKVCDLRPANVVAEINWQNEKLVPKRNGSETRSKCEKVGHCNDDNDDDVNIDVNDDVYIILMMMIRSANASTRMWRVSRQRRSP